MPDQPRPDEAADAAHEAVDAERLLPSEDPESRLLEDAQHWRAVYRELLGAKIRILDLTRNQMQAASDASVRDELSLDETVMRAELDRLQRRLRFWEDRTAELEGS